ncbi:MAG TPA: hypothetical protein VN770_03695 [Gaiellaceae bacterium]|nr:hypothetical protein [Gaiellaceae bacterium]
MPNPPHEHAVEPGPSTGAVLARVPHALAGLLADSPGSRFLTRRMAVAVGLYLLVTASLCSYSVDNDGRVYLDFLRRLTGESATGPSTHQWGSALVTLPLFLVARLLGVLGIHTMGHAPLEQVSMAATTAAALVGAVYLGWKLLRRLDLPAGPGVLALTVVGTPLFYYSALQGTYKHAIDAFFVTLEWFVLLLVLRRPSRRLLLVLGACLGLSITIRTANAALVPGMLLPFLLRRNVRGAATVLGTTAVVTVVLFAIPSVAGISGGQLALPQFATPIRLAAGTTNPGQSNFFWCRNYTYRLTFAQCLRNKLGVQPDPAAPAKMLFTLHRGLFLWTPLTALATIGFLLLMRRRRDERHYLAGIGVAALCLLLVHMLWGDFWDNGFSFSQRFLTALFPFFLLGTAELVRRWRGVALAALSVCALFSLVIALTFFVGYKGITAKDGVDRIVKLYTSGERTPQQLVRRIGVDVRGRWLGS